MYTGHFSLREAPFAITPDPRYLYFGERHTEALAHLSYGVAEDGGFVLLTGEVGTGKTTLVRRLLGRLPEDMDVALVLNPRLTVPEFVATVCEELGVPVDPAERSLKRLVDALNHHLLEAHAAGRRTIVLVDEAQDLLPDVLEQVRLLTNLETASRKLLRLVLVGQPELRTSLARDSMRQLRQRITTRYHLEPLTAEETESYIRHRLEVAGGDPRLFTRGAARSVHRRTGGIPRLINILCDRAMLAAFVDAAPRVERAAVARAWDEMRDHAGSDRGHHLGWGIAATAVVAAAALGLWWAGLAPETSPGPQDPTRGAENTARAGPPIPVTDGPGAAAMASETDPCPDPPCAGDTDPETAPDPTLPVTTSVPDSDRGTALRRVLARWGRSVAPGLDPCAVASEAGFRCSEGTGSWRNLEVLDLPAALELADGSYASLVGLSGDEVLLMDSDGPVRVPRRAVDERWFGEFVVFWRPLDRLTATLYPGDRDPAVPVLREHLRAALGAEATLPRSPGAEDERYDTGLRSAVAEFQRRQRLKVDGIAGPQTLMVLAGEAAGAGRPSLSERAAGGVAQPGAETD